MKIRVYYEDTDAGGVVYHSNYLKFCERARSQLFFENSINIFDANKGHFLIAFAQCFFKASAKLGDILEVDTKLVELKKASLIIEQKIFKQDVLCFSATFKMAYLKQGKVAPMPAELSKLIKELF